MAKMLLTVFFGSVASMIIAANLEAATILVPDNYKTIQEAVNGASPGDTVIVREGDYKENIVISKPLTVRSYKGTDDTVVRAAVTGKPVFEVKNIREAEVSGFTATGSMIAGIYIDASENVKIKDNKAVNNGSGIILSSSGNNTLANNSADSNRQYGIYLKSSDKNILEKNSVRSNMDTGIYIRSSSYNSVTGNKITLNAWNGILLWASHANTIEWNKVLRNRFSIVLSDSNNNIIKSNSTWPNIYVILPIVLIYMGIVIYLLQKSLFRFIYKS